MSHDPMTSAEQRAKELARELESKGLSPFGIADVIRPYITTAILEAENAKLEEAARCAENPGFIQARDTEWDMGVNYAKPFIAAAIRSLISKKEPVDLVEIGTAALERGLNSKPKD